MKAPAILLGITNFFATGDAAVQSLPFQHDELVGGSGMSLMDFMDGAVMPSQTDERMGGLAPAEMRLLVHLDAGPGLSLRQFSERSKQSIDDFVKLTSDEHCHDALKDAVCNKIISPYAAAWGSLRGFYPVTKPVLDPSHTIQGIFRCPTGRSPEHAGPGMSLQQFQDAAARNDAAQRCLNGSVEAQCQEELQYAMRNGIVSFFAADWGSREGFYPVIDRRDEVQSVCRCGCFEENTRILVKREEGASEVAVKALTKGDRAVVLGPEATLTELTYEDKPLKSLVKGSEERELYVFRMEDGRSLKLTQHHGAVLADGRVIAASEVRAGDAFLAYETGAPVTVAAVDRETTPGLVYNFEVDAQNDLGHIVVAEGLLVGDLVWQNQKARELGSIVIRQ